MWDLRFTFRSPERPEQLDPRRLTKPSRLPGWTVPIAVMGTIYAVQTYRGVSIDGDTTSGTSQTAFKLTGRAPLNAETVQINRNGEVWDQSVAEGRFATSVKLLPGVNHIQASINGTVSRTIDVNGPSPVSAMTGECKGTANATRTSGYQDDLFSVIVTIDPASPVTVSRVSTDNPLCHNCEAIRTGSNRYEFQSHFIGGGGGTFQVEFIAYDAQNIVRCRGTTVPLTVFTKP